MIAARLLSLVATSLVVVACGSQEARQQPEGPTPIEVGRDSVAVVEAGEIRTGPLISGELSASREATVRAEVGGALKTTNFEIGQPVKAGAVLARIEARDLNDAVTSEQVAVRSAEAALQLAESEARRSEALVAGGALARRDLETAQNAVATARSQLAAARARLASAGARLGDTVVRAPIGGIVSSKSASTGDVVTVGAALCTIVDPSSMRLEASVPSDQIQGLRPGVEVRFTVRGYQAQTFSGRVERVSPAVDPRTRQVPILVSIPNAGGRLISGLYAEGRVQTDVRRGLVVPGAAIDATAGSPAVIRVRDGRAERVSVTLGLRDRETERVEVLAGLSAGDVVLTGPARSITPRTPVKIAG